MSDTYYGYFMDGPWLGKYVVLDGATEVTMHVAPVQPIAKVVRPLPLREGMKRITYKADTGAVITTDAGTRCYPLWVAE